MNYWMLLIGLLVGFAIQYVVYLATGWSVGRVVRAVMAHIDRDVTESQKDDHIESVWFKAIK